MINFSNTEEKSMHAQHKYPGCQRTELSYVSNQHHNQGNKQTFMQ
jgi:hypothetical protein